MNLSNLWKYRERLKYSSNLIHCITNPISMNDCANAVLALGAKPIMAQHPQECVQITAASKALAVNLGNFDDVRAESMMLSGSYASKHEIPVILDAVGVACSDIRLAYAHRYIDAVHPVVIKGNLSEMKALSGLTSHAVGIDTGEVDEDQVVNHAHMIQTLARKYQCTILCTGKQDIMSDGVHTLLVHNGCDMMTLCTGTGCMLNVLCASFLSVTTTPYEAAVAATVLFGCVAEKSYESVQTPGQFHMRLFDWLYALQKEDFMTMANVEELTI